MSTAVTPKEKVASVLWPIYPPPAPRRHSPDQTRLLRPRASTTDNDTAAISATPLNTEGTQKGTPAKLSPEIPTARRRIRRPRFPRR